MKIKKSTNIYFRGVVLGILAFVLLQLVLIPFGLLIKNIGIIGVLLTCTLLVAGFVTGKIVGKNGFLYGFLTGLSIYLVTIFLFAIFVMLMSIKYNGGITWDNFNFLVDMLKYSISVILISSLVTGLGGMVGARMPNSK